MRAQQESGGGFVDVRDDRPRYDDAPAPVGRRVARALGLGRRRDRAREWLLWIEPGETGPVDPEEGWEIEAPISFEQPAPSGPHLLVHFDTQSLRFEDGAWRPADTTRGGKVRRLVPREFPASLATDALAEAWSDFKGEVAEHNRAVWAPEAEGRAAAAAAAESAAWQAKRRAGRATCCADRRDGGLFRESESAAFTPHSHTLRRLIFRSRPDPSSTARWPSRVPPHRVDMYPVDDSGPRCYRVVTVEGSWIGRSTTLSTVRCGRISASPGGAGESPSEWRPPRSAAARERNSCRFRRAGPSAARSHSDSSRRTSRSRSAGGSQLRSRCSPPHPNSPPATPSRHSRCSQPISSRSGCCRSP